MGVQHRFFAVVGVPAEGLADQDDVPFLARAEENHARSDDEESNLVEHLTDLLPGDLRAYEAGEAPYGGKATFVVGKMLLGLQDVKGMTGWDTAGPLAPEAFHRAWREVAEDLRSLRGAEAPRVFLLCYTW